MKTPDYKMTRQELVNWIWDNDKLYYYELCIEDDLFRSNVDIAGGIDELILTTIKDAVYHTDDYNDYVAWNTFTFEEE